MKKLILLILLALPLLSAATCKRPNIDAMRLDIAKHKMTAYIEPLDIAMPDIKPPYGDAEITAIAQVMYNEARGIPDKAQIAAVGWCILNRYDAGFADTITGVITAPYQFAYKPDTPVADELYALAEDVLSRWWREQQGETDVGRTLPSDYCYFSGDGVRNNYTQEYAKGSYWDWTMASPYEVDG